MSEGAALTWREVVDKHHAAVVDELTSRLDAEMQTAIACAVAAERSQADTESSVRVARASEEARRSQVESLNQILRRFRATGKEHVLDLVAEGCAEYADCLVVLVFEGNQARSAAGIGLQAEVSGSNALSFDVNSARAIAACIESRDPMVALAEESEISSVLASQFQPALDGKAYLFPILARHSVVAMLIASGVSVSAPIELLCEAAGMSLEAGPAPEKKQAVSGLVQLAPISAVAETTPARSWDDLTAGDQRLHLQAQRTARVRVAEMRLYHQNELKSGVAAGDIYGALRDPINAARDQFLQTFLAHSPTMVDYLHLEILRGLAHDDDRLLGHDYPGPMV